MAGSMLLRHGWSRPSTGAASCRCSFAAVATAVFADTFLSRWRSGSAAGSGLAVSFAPIRAASVWLAGALRVDASVSVVLRSVDPWRVRLCWRHGRHSGSG